MYKFGDKVRITTTDPKYGWGNASCGDVGVVTYVDYVGSVVRIEIDHSYQWYADFKDVELVSRPGKPPAVIKQPTKTVVKQQPTKMEGMENKTYQFNVAHPNMIDFDSINKDLSVTNPVAIVITSNKKSYVVVHNTLCAKAALCKCDIVTDGVKFFNTTQNSVVYVMNTSKIHNFINRLKKIRKAPYEKKKPTSCAVSFPNM